PGGDCANEPLILYDRESPITVRTLAFLLDEGVFPRIAVEIDHLEALKDLVRAGVGVGVVPRWSALRELAAGALFAVGVAGGRVGRAGGPFHVDRPRPARATPTVHPPLPPPLPPPPPPGRASPPRRPP